MKKAHKYSGLLDEGARVQAKATIFDKMGQHLVEEDDEDAKSED